MLKFTEFVDKKKREAKKQLVIIEKLLESKDFEVKRHLDEDDPFLFTYNPNKNTFFEGIRIYKIGDDIAFRVQKEERTEPFGRAYPIDVEKMFEDYMTDFNAEEAGKKVIEAIAREVKKFFEKSAIAEKDIQDRDEFDANPYNKVVVRTSNYGTDYSNLVYMKS